MAGPATLLTALWLGVSTSSPSQAIYPIKLHGGSSETFGDVTDFKVSPDGSRVVYVADQDHDEVFELYSVPDEGGTPVKLNDVLATSGDVIDFEISPDSARVVYRADQETDEVAELYAVPIDGGTAAKLNGTLVTGGSVSDYLISPDSARVVYRADQETDEVQELFSVDITGGTPDKLNGTLTLGGNVSRGYLASPDSSRVVYRADQDTDDVIELFSVPITGGAPPTKLNPTITSGGNVRPGFRITPDSGRVVFRASLDATIVIELHSVPIAGGTAVKLNGPLVTGGDVYGYLAVSPDSSRVFYRADQDTDGVVELYSVEVTGGAPIKLNGGLVAGGNVDKVVVSPDSSRVVYYADQAIDEVPDLYSVPATGGSPVELHPGGNVYDNFQISPEGGRVVYRAYDSGYAELYSVPIAGGTPVKLNGSLVLNGDVTYFMISSDGSRVVYRADQDTDATFELFSVPTAGGTPVALNGSLVPGGDVESTFEITADGGNVVFLADQDVDDVFELFSVPATGATPTKLNEPLAIGGSVYFFRVSADQSRLVYRAPEPTTGATELFSIPTTGGERVKLNDPLTAGKSIYLFYISPDSTTVVYIIDQETDGVFELYAVPIDGGTPVKLNAALPPDADVHNFRISPDSSRVVYVADIETDDMDAGFNRGELYSVPITGGTSVRISGAMVEGGYVQNKFEISPDSSRVLYYADQDTDGVVELYSVAITGGPVVKLNGTLVAGGDVNLGTALLFSPDGSRVCYVADQVTDRVAELFSVPIDGGSPIKLNAPLVSGGALYGHKVSPLDGRVVYAADQETDGVVELFSVGIFGGTPAKLSPPAVPGGQVHGYGFEITPDGNRVVYMADQDTDDVIELFSVPITGGSSTKINAPLEGQSDVLTSYPGITITADGSRVIYVADRTIDGVNELYSAPVAGGASIKLSGDLVASGVVADYSPLSPDGSLGVYRADQDTDNVFELYLWKAQALWNSGGGDWFTAANWRHGALPGPSIEALIAEPAIVTIPWTVAPATAESLLLGGASGPSVLELQAGAVLDLNMGAEIAAGGVLRGDGTVSTGGHPLSLPLGAELRTGTGQRFALLSGAVTNGGSIEASGRNPLPAEMEFASTVTNLAGTGLVTGSEAILRFDQGLDNFGALGFGGGFNEVRGEVANQPGGLLTISGGATVIFYDDVSNAGLINVSASGSLSSTAVFFGAFSGSGVSGGGHVFLEGDTRPGFSPGVMSFGGDVSFGPALKLEAELAGTDPGSGYDRVEVAGHLELGGTLCVVLRDGFVPAAGTVFDLWTAGSQSGEFSTVELPALPEGLFWHAAGLPTTGELSVGVIPETWAAYAAHYALKGGPDADDDGDGLSNLLEFMAGNDPLAGGDGTSFLQMDASQGGGLRIRFPAADPPGADLVVEIQASSTLLNSGPGAWTTVASRTGAAPWSGSTPVDVAPAGDGLVWVTLEVPTGVPKGFYRLSLSLAQ